MARVQGNCRSKKMDSMAAGGWSNVFEALGDAGANQREDDAASRTPSTLSRVSYLPSVHSQQRAEERDISVYQIKEAKVNGGVSLFV
jgi:hypothetical protein